MPKKPGKTPERPAKNKLGAHKVLADRVASLDALGETEVFAKYAELGTVRSLVEHLWKPHGGKGQVGTSAFYEWLDADPSGRRREVWAERKAWRAHDKVEEIEQAIAEISPENATAQRVKIEALARVAGLYNRKDYGAQKVDVAVEHNMGQSFLEAMRALEASNASPTIQGTTEGTTEVIEGEWIEVDR